MELKIYNQSGELKLIASTSSSSTWNQELMAENALSVSFTHTAYVPLAVNDYAMLEGVKFSVKKEYKPKQKNRQTYSYSVKLYAPIHDAEQVKYLYLTDGEYNLQFSLDGTPREHLQKWTDNMNRISGGPQWSVGDVIITSRKTIDYNNTSCWEALGKMADAFDTEWWVDGYVINLSRCEHGQRIPLGYLKGLTSLTQTENSDNVKFFTRLIPLGSTRNIDRTRYGFSRLQLPGREKYIDRNTQYGLYEHVEEAAFADIFPHYTGTVTAVRSVQRKDNNGKPFTIYYFKDSGMAFDPNIYELPALKKRVSFQSGDLNGHGSDENGTYYFEVNWNSATKEWEIITIFPDETRQLPGGNLIPRVGDKYIPWNIQMPEDYERQAEQDYLAAVNDYLEKHSEDASKYGGDTDYIYIEENGVPLAIGQSVRLLSDEYFTSGYRHSRMTKVVRKLDNLNMATIECADSVGKGWKRQVDSSLSQLKYVLERQQKETAIDILKSWDEREPNDYRVFSALRILKELAHRSLSRLSDDTAAGLITFLKGLTSEGKITSKDFIEALKGIHIGENGSGVEVLPDGTTQAVVDRLYVKVKAYFETLEIRKKTHVGGEQILSPAGMKCIRVEEHDEYYRCFFLARQDGIEIHNEFTPGTLAISKEDNINEGASIGATNRYYWRKVVAVGRDYIDLSKTDCDQDSDAPAAGDDIVGLGHETDIARQGAIVLSSVSEKAPSITFYAGINSYSLLHKEIIELGYDKVTGKPYQMIYGDFYAGARDKSTYMEYTPEGGVKIRGIVNIGDGSTGASNLTDLPQEVEKIIPPVWDIYAVNVIEGAPVDVNSNQKLAELGDGAVDLRAKFVRNGQDVTDVMKRSALRLYEFKRINPLGHDDNNLSDEDWYEANKGKDVYRLTPGDVMWACNLVSVFDEEILENEYKKLK
ncbi:hypothetical protein HMPREF1981_02049 [Bacteroides pyogenes F0041]|uniref:Uncharacterized protein n=1 Tax=Bacteroides pyogenes F0041 TaxID=1321819 RepID=U2DU55_9BACE|nr:hypothetical protein [Bacteroides pyogenes]ERI85162.1 hypothetical protein HMPREF1981_02049 [Bacteroides pyogenes F0041]MBB3894401.1 hypothetical protein [Bacteroides pyogenes]SUV35503.1 Uncharacterised protein [Bacteroides pyogenes]